MQKEQRFLKKLEKKTDYRFIFADGKYGFYSRKRKSYLLTHQLSFEIPKIFSFSQKFMDYFNKEYFSQFTKVFIPDYEDSEHNLAGKLSHPKWLSKIPYQYIGILSSFLLLACQKKQKSDERQQIDYLFTISGYLAEHRDSFIKKLIKEAKHLPGKKVFLLWDTKSKDYYHHDEENDIEIYAFLAGEEKIKKFRNAKTIISRAGYTTIMDLVELETPAILFPTPNQTEQEYLAKYLHEKNFFVCGKPEESLQTLVKKLWETRPFQAPSKTRQALETIYSEIGE